MYSLAVYQVVSKSYQTQNKTGSERPTLSALHPTSILLLGFSLAFPGIEIFI